ncbi:hypothetical protein O181_054929 [Austropuccinia psidii MF-1]|uniref:Integrase zinc-binding domain-containing protein n=1 Tax=Austropuccinia psidii MF-1 TaxID=1389203 RepID=A0A9Q3HU43_9BASI|nr:hypothetical protein [Austropuccinia psidii MF-1]
MWQKDVAEYCKTCEGCQKANKSTGKRLGNMITIREPRRPWEIFHMDWVTGLPPGGDRGYNACVVIVDRFSKTPIFLPCHKDDTVSQGLLVRKQEWPGTQESRTHLEGSKGIKEIKQNEFLSEG